MRDAVVAAKGHRHQGDRRGDKRETGARPSMLPAAATHITPEPNMARR
jgi:hypothetical protein